MSSSGRAYFNVTRLIWALCGVLILQISCVSGAVRLEDPCQYDGDCGLNAACWFYGVSPACQMGKCVCKSNFYNIAKNPYDCYPPRYLPLNTSCSNEEFEQYPPGAYCFAGTVQCKMQYQRSFNSCVLLPTIQSEYGKPCVNDAYCNLEIGLFCNLALRVCSCTFPYIWVGNRCEEAYYGTTCETDDNCQGGGAYTRGGPGNGGKCSNDHVCVCDTGFTTVNLTQFYLDDSGETLNMIQTTWTICVVNKRNTVGQDVGQVCTVPLWSSRTPITGQQYCSTGLGCIICPEVQLQSTGNNTNTTLLGTCRNGGTALRSNFAVAALLSTLYVLTFIVKLLTMIFGGGLEGITL